MEKCFAKATSSLTKAATRWSQRVEWTPGLDCSTNLQEVSFLLCDVTNEADFQNCTKDNEQVQVHMGPLKQL